LKKIIFLSIITTVLIALFSLPAYAELSKGNSGDDVSRLQTVMKKEGCFSYSITGYFGDITQQAIKDFQRKHSLPVTGEIDAETMSALNLTSAILTPQNTPGKSLYINDSGNPVKLLQDKLSEKGFSSKYIIPSYYCEITASLVSQYQKSIGLPADGIAGELTLSKLGLFIPEEGINALKVVPKTTSYYESNSALVILRDVSSDRESKDTIILKDIGDDVKLIQERLKELIGHTPFEVLMGAVLGIFIGFML
jgi:peptidoglycan hydrolase-like protein with peptidoglycan-binding domain